MRRLQRHLLARWLGVALPMLAVIAALLLALTIGDSLRWTRDVPAAQVLEWVLLQLPAILVRVAPVVFLTASALVIGELSARREALAARAGGVHVARLLRPWWVVLVLVGLTSLAASEWWVPAAERRAAELWWQITEGRPATFRLRGLDLQLGDGTALRFARYDEAADVLLDVRVTRTEGALLAVTRAERARWDEHGLRFEGATRTLLDLGALDRGLGAEATLAALVDGPAPLEALALPEARSETVARYSGGTVGDGRSLTRQFQVANDPGSAYGARRWSAFVLHERIAAAFAPLVLTFGAAVIGLRSAPSVLVAFAVSASVGIGWFVLAALGHWLVVAVLLPPWAGAWLGQLVVIVVSAAVALRR